MKLIQSPNLFSLGLIKYYLMVEEADKLVFEGGSGIKRLDCSYFLRPMSSEYSLRMSFCIVLKRRTKMALLRNNIFCFLIFESFWRHSSSKHTHLITRMSHTNRSPDRWHVLKSRSAAVTRTLPESISPHPFFARMPVKYITCCMVMRRASDHAPALSVVSLSF